MLDENGDPTGCTPKPSEEEIRADERRKAAGWMRDSRASELLLTRLQREKLAVEYERATGLRRRG